MTKLDDRMRLADEIPVEDRWPEIRVRQADRPAPAFRGGERRWATVVAALVIGTGAVAIAVAALTGRTDRLNSSPTIPPPLAQNGVIAYAGSGKEGLFWTIEPNGSDPRQVTVDVPGTMSVPSWSPDGSRIAFSVTSYEDPHPKAGNYDIYAANADGTDPVRLTRSQSDRSPVWSPDGTRIAYMHDASTAQVWVMNADGSDAHRLTSGGDSIFPSWSPDGSQIVFQSWEGSNANIYVMSEDGSNVRRLTNDPSHEADPEWSPDGRLIAFTSVGGTRDSGIYTMARDGTGVTELLPDPDPANLGFAWSPDGESLAVVSISGPGFDRTLFVLDVATRELTAIVDPGVYVGPSWQPLPATTEPSPEASEVTATIETVAHLSPFPNAVAIGEGGAWVSGPRNDGSGGGDVVRLDPVTAEVVARIPVSYLPGWVSGGGGLAAGGGSVWVMGSHRVDGEEHAILSRIDPAMNQVTDEIDLGPGREGDVWAADGVVWAVRFTEVPNTLEVVRLDPADGRIEARIPIPGEWSEEIFAFDDSVWVLALTSGTDGAFYGPGSRELLIHIDAATNRYVAEVSCACAPFLAPSGSVFYVSTQRGPQRYDAASGEQIGDPLDTPASDGGFVPDDEGGLWLYQSDGGEEGRVFEHVDSDGRIVASGFIQSQERQAWVGIARAFDPATDSLWVVHYEDSVSLIRIG